MNCTICGKKMELNPSAKERSDKYGNTPEYYSKLFTVHTDCFLQKRKQETIDLCRKQGKHLPGMENAVTLEKQTNRKETNNEQRS